MSSYSQLPAHRIDTSARAPDSILSTRIVATCMRLEWFAVLMMWSLSVMVFTMPTAERTETWQPLDLVKLCVLAFACFGGAIVLWTQRSRPALRRVLDPLAPFYLFLLWALASVSWSSLPSVTIAQSGSLVAMLFLATTVAMVSIESDGVKRILYQLNWILLISSSVVIVAYLIDPEMSGLDRDRIHSGGDGLVHPTASGATASLGLLLPVLCHFVGRYAWAKRLLLPSLLIHGSVLVLSNSRTAIVMAGVTIGLVLFRYCSNRQRALAIFAAAAVSLAVLVVDPGFELMSSTAEVGAQFVSRGQTGEQLKGVSGRGELWSAIWKEYEKSMLVGHGYFVSSEAGSLHVWNQSYNYTAHNLCLQILVSTGAIGLLMLCFALLQGFGAAISLRHGTAFQRRICAMALVIAIWFFGWSQLGDSFLGPIRPESILFFTLLGIAIGQSTTLAFRAEDAQSSPNP